MDFFIANSNFVAQRIKNTYNRNSTTIYPPIDTEKFLPSGEKENYYLSASRLVGYKKTKLIVEAFNVLGLHLKVIGEGEELEDLKQIAKENVEILGYQNDEDLIKYMQKAKAFVYMALEDFGIVPVEAQSTATPVIALGEGGTKESVLDGVTRLHVKEQNISSLMESVKKFESQNIIFEAKTLRDHAKKFSKERFRKEFTDFFQSKYQSNLNK